MAWLTGLGASTTLLVVCAVLFVEEAGLPLPAPGEVALAAAGLGVAGGELLWWVFLPAAVLACTLGALVGYSWAHSLGLAGPRAIARWLHAERSCERVIERLRTAGPRAIAGTRLVPGLRIYTTLGCGAVGVRRRVFLAGTVPATCLWVAAWTAVGAVAGQPAVRLLGAAEAVALHAALLVLVALGILVAVRRARRRLGMLLPPGWRAPRARADWGFPHGRGPETGAESPAWESPSSSLMTTRGSVQPRGGCSSQGGSR